MFWLMHRLIGKVGISDVVVRRQSRAVLSPGWYLVTQPLK